MDENKILGIGKITIVNITSPNVLVSDKEPALDSGALWFDTSDDDFIVPKYCTDEKWIPMKYKNPYQPDIVISKEIPDGLKPGSLLLKIR